MGLLYIALGIFLLSGKSAPIITDTMTVIIGIVLICMGLLRSYSAYTNYKNTKNESVNNLEQNNENN